jgi:hypothetical protein
MAIKVPDFPSILPIQHQSLCFGRADNFPQRILIEADEWVLREYAVHPRGHHDTAVPFTVETDVRFLIGEDFLGHLVVFGHNFL